MTSRTPQGEVQSRCKICGRTLNLDSDPVSGDCGGDCWGCVGWIEATMMGHDLSVRYIQQEIKEAWREADGSPKPQASLTMSYKQVPPSCPHDLEEAIGCLRTQGWSKNEFIRWLFVSRRLSLSIAKEVVCLSNAWIDRRIEDDAFRNALADTIFDDKIDDR